MRSEGFRGVELDISQPYTMLLLMVNELQTLYSVGGASDKMDKFCLQCFEKKLEN